ncbi:phage baseplate protein [Burkholderia multivorans]|uniref:phage baseplate protein n=1 Tax=Burkholderia multivorans TaxID=87883 RepID=UPI000667E48B|nr:hypothetical protein [Burkholderia multivorans]
MPNILFPNVPNVAGVPPLLRKVSTIGTAVAGAIAVVNKFGSLANWLAPQWGIYDQNMQPVLVADSVVSVEFHNESRISDFPIESGSFGSYNKVATPYDARVRLSCGRDEASRQAFLATLDAVAASTDLYHIATPDATYYNANIVAYDYRREQRAGAGLIVADVILREVRQIAMSMYSNSNAISADQAKDPGSVSPYSFGQVQAYQPTTTQAALFGPTTPML